MKLIFLIIAWNLSTFSSGNDIYHLQFLLGCQAKIPCQRKKSDSDSFRWLYKKDEHSDTIQIFFEDKQGLQRHNVVSRKGTVTHDRAFVINHFAEDDQGLYWCENCYRDNCKHEQSTVIRVTKEILSEIHDTVYVTAGSNFTYSCPGEFTTFKWTFDASYTTALGNSAKREADFVTSNKSIHIENVKNTDAGKYTCWVNKCNTHRWKRCTVNLCVITVHQSENSPVSCAVICEVEFGYIKSNSTTHNVKGARTVSPLVNPHRSSNCSTKQKYDAHSTISSANESPNASVQTTGTHTQHEGLTPVICGTSAAITCLILLAFLTFYFRSRLRADISENPFGRDNNGMEEEDFSGVYSSVVFRSPDNTSNNDVTCNDCVYSEIKV